MQEILARCGFRCDLCPAYFENIKSYSDKERVCKKWKQYFDIDVTPEHINCKGCLSETYLDSGCPVRPCVIEKNFESCAPCSEFICSKLATRTDAIDAVIKKYDIIPEEDFEIFIKPYLNRERLQLLRNKL